MHPFSIKTVFTGIESSFANHPDFQRTAGHLISLMKIEYYKKFRKVNVAGIVRCAASLSGPCLNKLKFYRQCRTLLSSKRIEQMD